MAKNECSVIHVLKNDLVFIRKPSLQTDYFLLNCCKKLKVSQSMTDSAFFNEVPEIINNVSKIHMAEDKHLNQF